ncbi:hypothetical protein [Convivina praedatoris]|uniref:Uncharacterized protein n=1 Tax=Convivina praedatoris TaxID=2880963 RepID=A0ABN8HCM4_9LACO|nr:hypothetical protein [Convivina sp. LMG 32447]CAH1856196.1 hypothetical protein LMG032447_01253 [Convivina sp. LMG 32447]
MASNSLTDNISGTVPESILIKMFSDEVKGSSFKELITNTNDSPESFRCETVLIAKKVYRLDEGQITTLKNNSQHLSELLGLDDEEISSETNKVILKFLSHIDLSIEQREFILGNLQERRNALSEIRDTKARIYGDFIAILGIFSALIFGLFGGFNELSSVVTSSVSNGLNKTFIFGSLLGFMLVTLIFLLIHSIGMLTGKRLLACGCNNTVDCSHKFAERYPIFFVSLVGCLLVFILGITMSSFSRFTLYSAWVKDEKGKNAIDFFNAYQIVPLNSCWYLAGGILGSISIVIIFCFTWNTLFSKNKKTS